MKCKACNGTGYVTACVYESDEIGFVDKNYECAVCHGTGQILQTNEEWFTTLSTEEKAKWIFRLTCKCYWCGREYEETNTYNEKECPFQKCMQRSKDFAAWLKEKHE